MRRVILLRTSTEVQIPSRISAQDAAAVIAQWALKI